MNKWNCDKCNKEIDVDSGDGVLFYSILTIEETGVEAKCKECIRNDNDTNEIKKLDEHIYLLSLEKTLMDKTE